MHRVQTLPTLLLVSAVALACVAATGLAQAQSSVAVYGLLDLSVGQFQNAGGLKVKRLDSGNMSTSYLGFRGSEDLGGGLRASFQLDSFIQVDSGNAGRVTNVDGFWGRNANVSLSGSFGSVRLGRQGPAMFVSTLLFNAFGDSFGYSPAIRQYYSNPAAGTPLIGDSGWNNTIGYTLPKFGGLAAMVQVAAGEGAANSRGKNLGGHLLYFAGPLGLTAAWQSVKSQGTLGRPISAFPGFTEQTAFQFGGSFDTGVAKLFAQYGSIETKATRKVETKNLHFGARVPIGAGALLAQYGNSKVTAAGVAASVKSTVMTFGYDHFLSKRTDVYAVLMQDKLTGASTGTTYAAGVRHTF